MAILDSKWKCLECGEVHDDECEALDCCAPKILEIYLCPICDEEHNTEKEAVACCGYVETEDDSEPNDTRRFPKTNDPAIYIREFQRINFLKNDDVEVAHE